MVSLLPIVNLSRAYVWSKLPFIHERHRTQKDSSSPTVTCNASEDGMSPRPKKMVSCGCRDLTRPDKQAKAWPASTSKAGDMRASKSRASGSSGPGGQKAERKQSTNSASLIFFGPRPHPSRRRGTESTFACRGSAGRVQGWWCVGAGRLHWMSRLLSLSGR